MGDEGRFLLPADLTTALLSRTLISLGPLCPVTPETVRDLTVGDRDALLLHLRRAALGDKIACVLRCPDSSCGEVMDLDLSISDMLAQPYSHERRIHEVVIDDEGTKCTVRFRLPSGGDQEAAARLALAGSLEQARDSLLDRCVENVASNGNGDMRDRTRQALARHLPATMLELDPQAEIRLNMNCSRCGRSFSLLFDPATHFFEELSGTLDQLYHEVHLLAQYYHWTEAEILGLSNHRRRRYVEQVVEAGRRGRGPQ